MTIWEHCSHLTLSERPILYNYAWGEGGRKSVNRTEPEWQIYITELGNYYLDLMFDQMSSSLIAAS